MVEDVVLWHSQVTLLTNWVLLEFVWWFFVYLGFCCLFVVCDLFSFLILLHWYL